MLVGLTGGIGSGKSVIASELRRRGYQVLDTDAEAKRIIVQNDAVRAQIIALFGEDAYINGNYNSHKVAQQVFSRPNKLDELNAIVHPYVKQSVLSWYANLSGICFVESALLYSSQLDQLCDRVISVVAEDSIRVRRVMLRDHCSEDSVRARINSQKNETNMNHSDWVICNNGLISIEQLVDELLVKCFKTHI